MRALLPALGALAMLATVSGCNNNTGSAVSFAFNRPERLEFACLAPYPTTIADLTKRGQYAVLPRACCTLYEASNYRLAGEAAEPGVDPSAPNPDDPAAHPECTTANGDVVGSPVLHALVTQSTRGEVAAVDLVDSRVIDSDRQVPGYTFIDSGGLPSAIVVPPRQPRFTSLRGPEFVYVASAEEGVVRAIPTCRFRNGSSCGPDKLPANLNDLAGYKARLRVDLRGTPEDMILGPDEALWITLPDSGLIARVELPVTPADGRPGDAFALSSDPATPGVVAQPKWFRVPAVGDATLGEPVTESSDYVATCGLGSKYQPTNFSLPLAPRATGSAGSAEPTRLYLDAETQLLFVADRNAPAIHVFKLGTDGALTALGAMPTGQPVREFVITPRVPATAIAGAALLQDTVPAEDASTESKRYLYAIDTLGTVGVYQFVANPAGGVPTLTPLLVPQPDLFTTRYADRINLPVPAQTLAVIDTRTQSRYTCGQESVDALRERKRVLADLPKPLSAELLREQARVDARIAVYDTADLDYLRGVFVAVASSSGVLSVIDVHDLDNLCRAQKFCCASDGQGAGPNGRPQSCTSEDALNAPRSSDSLQSLAVRRHALRRRSAGPQTADVATSTLLQTQTCDASDPSAAVQTLAQVCTPADPWTTYTETWRVDFEGTLPDSQMQYASFEVVADTSKLALVAPADFNLCERGVEVGDLVAVVGTAPAALRANCPDPSVDAAPTFVIEQASTDRLLLTPRPVDGESAEGLRQRMLDCYPDFVGVELRASNFLVLGSTITSYLHRVTTAADGSCVVNEALDPLLDSRMRQGQVSYRPPASAAEPNPAAQTIDTLVFHNPFVSFALAPADANVLPTTRETSLTVQRSNAAQQLNTVISGDQVTNALPSTLQYMPEVGYLFLLDTAGQGLRRYTLRPFERENTVFR